MAEPPFIPLHEPMLTGAERKYVTACLDSGWVSSAGPMVSRFERAVADFLGARHAVATVNGTAALHTALRVLGVGADDEVVVSTLTFIAPVNAVRYCGAHPVLMDADAVSWNMDPLKTVEFLERECAWRDRALRNRTTGRRIAVILPVHILGHPVDLDPILAVAGKYGVPVVEDATESLGALYRERPVGTLGDLGCFSFNGNKVVTTGGGGMIVTAREEYATRARHLTVHARSDPHEYVHDELGYNYRMPSLNAALGLGQMEQLPGMLQVKREAAECYRRALEQVEGLVPMPEAAWARSSHWLFTVLLDGGRDLPSRTELLRRLRERGIEARSLWVPMHRLDLYRHAQAYRVEWADRLYERAVSLPSSPGLTEADQQRVIAALLDILSSPRSAVAHGSSR